MLIRTAICCLTLLVCTAVTAQSATLRVDYFHSGSASSELFSLDEIVREPLPWPGNPQQPIDELLRGKYVAEVLDGKSGKLVYSRGFSSIYGEWETTAEARTVSRTYHESVRLPDPGKAFTLVIKKRADDNRFKEVWRLPVDPTDYLVRAAHARHRDAVVPIEVNGDPADKVDLLLLGDGYTPAEHDAFIAKARQLTATLLATAPFSQRRKDFNVWALAPAAHESGVSRPSTGIYLDSPLGTTYDAFRSERYVLTFANKSLREIAQSAPYDFIEILTNTDTYGGGGIHGLYSTAAANSAWAEYLFIHEFAHHFAGLADEYYTSPVSYEAPDHIVEPYEPNVTALLDPANLKWRDKVTRGTSLPTEWPKEEYDAYARDYQARRVELRKQNRPEAQMDELFENTQAYFEKLFAASDNHAAVGAFEGANYQSTGFYRSQMNCIMFTRTQNFCAVCAGALDVVIDQYSRP